MSNNKDVYVYDYSRGGSSGPNDGYFKKIDHPIIVNLNLVTYTCKFIDKYFVYEKVEEEKLF